MSTAPLTRSLHDLEFSVGRRLPTEQHQAWTCVFSRPRRRSSCRERRTAAAACARRRVFEEVGVVDSVRSTAAPKKRANSTVGLLARSRIPWSDVAPPAGLVTELSVCADCFGGRGYSQLLDPGDGVCGDVDVEVGLVSVLVVGDSEGECVAELPEQVVGHVG